MKSQDETLDRKHIKAPRDESTAARKFGGDSLLKRAADPTMWRHFWLLESIDLLQGENISTCQQDQQAYLGLGAEDTQDFFDIFKFFLNI